MTTLSHIVDIVTRDDDSSSDINSEEPLLLKWQKLARTNRRLHDVARYRYKRISDTSLVVAVFLGSCGGIVSLMLGVADKCQDNVNTGQMVVGVTSIISAGIISLNKHLGWESKHQLHEEYSTRYNEVLRMISSEETLVKMNSSTYASRAEFIKAIKGELDRIEDHSPKF